MPGLDSEVEELVQVFINDFKKGKFQGSVQLAFNTIQLLRKITSQSKWTNARELLEILKCVGKQLKDSAPSETVIGNMLRRLLKIVRDEYTANRSKGKLEEVDDQESLHKIVTGDQDQGDLDYTETITILKASIMDSIGELLMELETSAENIAGQALEHIHSNEIIMTMGKSKTVESFLKNAAKQRTFQVIVVECAPFYHGQKLAANLAKAGIHTTLIPDSAIFAIMARVNKVILGTHSVMANGGLKAICGSHTVALAAKHYSVPLIVSAPLLKLCPQFVCSLDQDCFNQFASPEDVLGFDEGKILSSVQICNPVFDYVPPELVTLFISNTGGHAPSYIYRLLSELYHPSDSQL